MEYNRITQAQLNEMQFDVGILLRSFDVQNPYINDSDILCATTGGISLNIVAEYDDLSEDVYMMTPGTMEMLVLTGWQVDAEFTTVTESAGAFKFILGAVDENNGIVPRYELKETDFGDIWWVGDRLDGGFVAIKFCNALSDEGVSLTATSRDKGTIGVHITAHGTLEGDKDAVPVEIYSGIEYMTFSVTENKYLTVDNLKDNTVTVNTSTGELIITSSRRWTYHVNESTGMMEVSD